MPLETWVFTVIFALAGILVIVCGLNQEGLSFAFTVAGVVTIGFGLADLLKKFKKFVERL